MIVKLIGRALSALADVIAKRDLKTIEKALESVRQTDIAVGGKVWVGATLVIEKQSIISFEDEFGGSSCVGVQFIASTPAGNFCKIERSSDGRIDLYPLTRLQFAELTLNSSMLEVA